MTAAHHASGAPMDTQHFILTPFTAGFGVDPADYGLDPEVVQMRDELFRQMVADLLNGINPTLIPTMFMAGSKVFACQGRFTVMTWDRQSFDVPELSAQLALSPWAEPGEIAH